MSAAVYVRTPEGQAAAYDQVSAMPRKLRSLLKVIDGKTSEAVFTTSLKAFGDVQGLLISLTHAGLIRKLQSSTDAATSEAEFATALMSASVKTTAPVPAPAPVTPPSSYVFEASTMAHTTQPAFANTEMATRPANSETAPAIQQAKQLALSGVVKAMSDFVLTHTPQHSFVILNELESITSLEQLAVLLGGYELMIRDAGEPADQHLSYIRRVLKEWM
jgi:hypothetical protein